jgi:hypothetical protein
MEPNEMNAKHETTELDAEFTKPPFLYEIRVKGRLSDERWTSWFDDLTVTVSRGQSILRGRVPDHAALYGLLGRLRDLAVPLVAVRVLDAEAQGKLQRQSRRYDLMINVLLVTIYLLLLGGLAAITVLISATINVALAITLLFAALAGLAHAFWLWSGQAFWRWLTYGIWPAAAITFLIYIPVSGVLPTPVGMAIMLFLAAGGLLYLVYWLRRRAERVNESLVKGPTSADSQPFRIPDDNAATPGQNAGGSAQNAHPDE